MGGGGDEKKIPSVSDDGSGRKISMNRRGGRGEWEVIQIPTSQVRWKNFERYMGGKGVEGGG